MRNKNNPQPNPEHQQSHRLQRIQEFHAPSPIWSAADLPPLLQIKIHTKAARSKLREPRAL
jgi:hypothetical protein